MEILFIFVLFIAHGSSEKGTGDRFTSVSFTYLTSESIQKSLGNILTIILRLRRSEMSAEWKRELTFAVVTHLSCTLH